MAVIGVGAGDTLELAQDFVATTGTESFPMVWDPSFDTWRHYGVGRNSQVWVLDPSGGEAETMVGLDAERVLQLAAELA